MRQAGNRLSAIPVLFATGRNPRLNRLARNSETPRRRQFIPVRAGQPPRAEPWYRTDRSQACPFVHNFAPCQLRDQVLIEWHRRPPNGADAFRTGVERRSIRSDRRDHPGRVSVTSDCIIFRIAADDIQFRTELGRRALIAEHGACESFVPRSGFPHLRGLSCTPRMEERGVL